MNSLSAVDFTTRDDPFELFDEWLADAKASEPRDHDAIALATAGPDGLPDVRMVLLRGVDREGFVFYSNDQSSKGRQLEANPQAAFVLYWKSLNRQIRVRGGIVHATAAESDGYFARRHPRSRAGAIASQQSRPLESRGALERAVEAVERQHPDGIFPRPTHWHGFRIRPTSIEFWQDQPSRLHDRIVFTRASPDGPWTRQRLYP